MIRVNDIVAIQNSRHVQCLIGAKEFKGSMATKEDKNLIEAMRHLNVAVDKLKIAVKNGNQKSEDLLSKLWFHRILSKGGVRC